MNTSSPALEWITVNSSHSQVVTWSTRHRHHSADGQLVTSHSQLKDRFP